MTIGCVQPGTRRGTFLQMIGSRKMVPPRILRMVPLGDFHIFLRLNSLTRTSSGVMVAHFIPTPYCLIAWRLPRSPYLRLLRGFLYQGQNILYRCQDRGG